jgi:hypothetical protein
METRIRRDAEPACQFIDLMEVELKHRETVTQHFAELMDQQQSKVA